MHHGFLLEVFPSTFSIYCFYAVSLLWLTIEMRLSLYKRGRQENRRDRVLIRLTGWDMP
jgi:hypothetical protein